jgi:hypothetical protein
MFASQSEAKITNLRIALANTKKLQMTTSAFLTKMQTIVDELASAGCPISSREHVSNILAGLGPGYDALVAALGVATTPIIVPALYAQLNAYEQLQELHVTTGAPGPEFESTANLASRQRQGRFNNKHRGDRGDREDRRDDRRDERRSDY